MDDARFGWLGESRQASLQSLVAAEVAEWSREWWLHHANAEVDVHLIDHANFVTKSSTSLVSHAATGVLATLLGGKGIDAIGRHLCGAAEHDDQGWAQRIGEEALEDLACRIFQKAGAARPAKSANTALSPDLHRAELGSCILAIALGRVGWNIIVDRQLAEHLVPVKTAARARLVARQAALNNVPLRVNAVIDFGSVNLTDLSDLRVGEILVGDRGLEEVLQLHVEGHGAVATGYLRRSETNHAVLLDGVNISGKLRHE